MFESIHPHRAYDRWSYRLFGWAQRLAALIALTLLLPLFVVLYVLVRLTSRGPFLFSQVRPGFLGQPVRVWKIRTMRVGSDQNRANGIAVTSAHPEVTAIGRLLRDLKIDELPQLWNIVRGDMEFVGPRPIAGVLFEKLCQEIPGFEERTRVKPGLTNLGQVSILENQAPEQVVEDWRIRFEAEVHYLQRKSVHYDLILIVLTMLYMARKVLRRVVRMLMPSTTETNSRVLEKTA